MTRLKQRKAKSQQPVEPTLLSFMDHVRELKGRLFWTAIWFVVASGIVFPFYHVVIDLLMQPLGGEKLYYLSPVGGLGFAMKICIYVGLIATLPVLVYHLYKFISPVLPTHRARTAIGYVMLSTLLAIAGIIFAFVVSLPSAMHFLTNFDLGNVSAMLTVDAYLSFVITYLFTSAALFQLPLIMVIIDTITPTPPSTWNRFQRHMIVAAFVIAMLITPVPDIINQFILALPIILMYQLGIVLIWVRHRTKRKKFVEAKQHEVPDEVLAELTPEVAPASAPLSLAQVVAAPEETPTPQVQKLVQTAVVRSMNDIRRPVRTSPKLVVPGRSIDGVMRRHAPATQPNPESRSQRPMRLGGLSVDGFLPAR